MKPIDHLFSYSEFHRLDSGHIGFSDVVLRQKIGGRAIGTKFDQAMIDLSFNITFSSFGIGKLHPIDELKVACKLVPAS